MHLSRAKSISARTDLFFLWGLTQTRPRVGWIRKSGRMEGHAFPYDHQFCAILVMCKCCVTYLLNSFLKKSGEIEFCSTVVINFAKAITESHIKSRAGPNFPSRKIIWFVNLIQFIGSDPQKVNRANWGIFFRRDRPLENSYRSCTSLEFNQYKPEN